MDVYCNPAREVYNEVPEGVEANQEIPWKIYLELEELSAEQGYVSTPMDRLFRWGMGKLRIPFKQACVIFPRSGATLMNQIAGGSLTLSAEKEENEKPLIKYNRRLYKSDGRVFDEFDKRDKIEEFLSLAKGKPIGEKIEFDLEGMTMEVHTGYDWGIALINLRDPHYDPETMGEKYSIGVDADIMPGWLRDVFGEYKVKLRKGLAGKKEEEIAEIAKGLLERYLTQMC